MDITLIANRIVNHNIFQNIVIGAIVTCSIILGVETYFPANIDAFIITDLVFSIFFIIEILIRMFASGSLVSFFKLFNASKRENGKVRIKVDEKAFWNWFDFLIVLFTTISLFKHLVEHPEFLIVSRLFRVLRILRLLEVSDELKMVEKKIISIIPTVFSFVLLLGILMYIYSIIGIYLFEHKSFEMADFSDLPGAFLTLFQLMTLDGWTEVMNSASSSLYDTWLIKGFFVSFIIFTAIISFNVFVAVLTTQVHEKMIEDSRKLENQKADDRIDQLVQEVKSLREEISKLSR